MGTPHGVPMKGVVSTPTAVAAEQGGNLLLLAPSQTT